MKNEIKSSGLVFREPGCWLLGEERLRCREGREGMGCKHFLNTIAGFPQCLTELGEKKNNNSSFSFKPGNLNFVMVLSVVFF